MIFLFLTFFSIVTFKQRIWNSPNQVTMWPLRQKQYPATPFNPKDPIPTIETMNTYDIHYDSKKEKSEWGRARAASHPPMTGYTIFSFWLPRHSLPTPLERALKPLDHHKGKEDSSRYTWPEHQLEMSAPGFGEAQRSNSRLKGCRTHVTVSKRCGQGLQRE